MPRSRWRNLMRRFLTRLVIPLAVILVFTLVLKMLAGTPPAPAKVRPPAIKREHNPPAEPRLGRDFTKSEPPVLRDPR